MKKLIAASILLALLSTAAFAQLKVGFTLDALTDFVHSKSYLDDLNDAKEGIDLGPGTTDVLTRMSYWDANEMRLILSYSNDNVKALLQLKGDGLVGNQSGSSFFKGNATLTDIWNAGFADYYVQGTAGKLVAYFGNENKRGVIGNYRFAHSDFLKNNMNNYGYFVPNFVPYHSNSVGDERGDYYEPSAKWTYGFQNYEGNNLAKIDGRNQLPHVDITYNFEPFSVTLAGALSEANAVEGASKIALGARVSGTKIADMVDFDLTYMITGGDPTLKSKGFMAWDGADTFNTGADGKAGTADDKLTAVGNYKWQTRSDKANGDGKWRNSFGIYAGLGNIIDNLGIGVGYTGSVVVQEDSDDVKNINPFFSGIDLRFRFTGVDKLTITLNNNFSFAATTGAKDTNTTGAIGIPVGEKDKDGYFAMHNALDVAYKVTDALTASFVLGNRAAWYEYTPDSGDKYKMVMDQLNIILFASYQFNANVQFESGIMMDLIHFTVDDGDTFKGGEFRFGIPIRVKFTW